MDWREPEDQDEPAVMAVAEGILATTRIATPDGWLPAGSLLPGTPVLTFDNGARAVVTTHFLPLGRTPESLWPLEVPQWALDNREEVILLPEQRVLIEADLAEDLYGDPFALIPAQALEGWRGIARCRPPEGAGAVVLGFERPEVIYASRGLLLSCPGPLMAEQALGEGTHSPYTLAQARHLVACLMAEEVGAALREPASPLPLAP